MNTYLNNIRTERDQLLHVLVSHFTKNVPQARLRLHVVNGITIKDFSSAFRRLIKNRNFGTYFYCFEISESGHFFLNVITTSDFNHDRVGLQKSWCAALSHVLANDKLSQCTNEQNFHFQIVSNASWVDTLGHMLKCDDLDHCILTKGIHKFGSSINISKKLKTFRSFLSLNFAYNCTGFDHDEKKSSASATSIIDLGLSEKEDSRVLADHYDFNSIFKKVIVEYRNDANKHISDDLIKDQLIQELACYNENLNYFDFNNFVRFLGTQKSRVGGYYMDLHLLFKKLLQSEEYQVFSSFQLELEKARKSVTNSNSIWKPLLLSFISRYYNSSDSSIVFLLSNCLFFIFKSDNKSILGMLVQLGKFLVCSFSPGEYENIMKFPVPDVFDTNTQGLVQLGHVLYILVKESVFHSTQDVIRIREEDQAELNIGNDDLYTMDGWSSTPSIQKKIHFEFDIKKLALLVPQFTKDRLRHIQLHTRMNKPFMVPPKSWRTSGSSSKLHNNLLFYDATSNCTGGLLLNNILLYRSLCKKPKKADHSLLLEPAGFDSVNKIQAIAYRVDRDLLQFYIINKTKLAGWLTPENQRNLTSALAQSKARLSRMYREKHELLQMANTNPSLLLTAISREGLVRDALAEKISHHFVLQRLLDSFSSITYEPFYFSQEYDFRMRMYPSPHELSYAAHKLSRSLIRFDAAGPFNINEFKLFCVSQYMETRDKTEDAKILIFEMDVRLLLENYKELDVIERINCHAKEPFLFYACAVEWCRYLKSGENPDTYQSNFPVYYDCTAQGPQIMSVFFALDQFKKYLNLCAQDQKGERGDYYSAVISQYLVRVKSPVSLSISEYQNKTDLGVVVRFDFIPNQEIIDWFRKYLKDAILPLIYGETFRKFGNAVSKMCHSADAPEILNKVFYISNLDTFTKDLSKDFWDFTQKLPIFAMRPLLKSYKESMELGSDGSIEWSVFGSNIIRQKYLKVNKSRLQSRVRERKYQFVVYEVFDEVLRSKQMSSLLANFTHSLDAWILRQLFDRCGFQIMSIHDSYGIHSGNITILRTQVRSLLLYLYHNGFVFFTEQWADYIEKSGGLEAQKKFLEVVEESKRLRGNLSEEDINAAYHFIS